MKEKNTLGLGFFLPVCPWCVNVCDRVRKEKGGRMEKSCRRDNPEWRLDKQEEELYGGMRISCTRSYMRERRVNFRDEAVGEQD